MANRSGYAALDNTMQSHESSWATLLRCLLNFLHWLKFLLNLLHHLCTIFVASAWRYAVCQQMLDEFNP